MTTWRPLDLTPILDGITPAPTLLKRTDGRCLLYEGQTHWVQGAPQTGKTWVALCAAAEVMGLGGHVSWNDTVHTPLLVVKRLQQLGVKRPVIERLFHYRADASNVEAVVHQAQFPDPTMRRLEPPPQIALMVIDGWSGFTDQSPFRREYGPQFGQVTTIVTEECRDGELDGMYGPSQYPVYNRADVAYHTQLVTLGGAHTRIRLLKDRYGALRATPKQDHPAIGELWIRDNGWEMTPGRESRLEDATAMEAKVVGFLRVEPMSTEQLFRMLGSDKKASKEKVVKGLADTGKIVARLDERGRQVWFAADDPEVSA